MPSFEDELFYAIKEESVNKKSAEEFLETFQEKTNDSAELLRYAIHSGIESKK